MATARAKSGGDKGAGVGAVGTTSGSVVTASADVETWGKAEVVGGVAVVVGGEPNISDTKLIGIRFLPELLRRLYGWKREGWGRALRKRREGAVVFHGVREEEAARASVETEQLNLLLLLYFSITFTSYNTQISQKISKGILGLGREPT